MIIPTESRAQLAAIREGLTEAEYVDAIWRRRLAEHRILRARKPSPSWPIVRAADLPANVMPMRKRKP